MSNTSSKIKADFSLVEKALGKYPDAVAIYIQSGNNLLLHTEDGRIKALKFQPSRSQVSNLARSLLVRSRLTEAAEKGRVDQIYATGDDLYHISVSRHVGDLTLTIIPQKQLLERHKEGIALDYYAAGKTEPERFSSIQSFSQDFYNAGDIKAAGQEKDIVFRGKLVVAGGHRILNSIVSNTLLQILVRHHAGVIVTAEYPLYYKIVPSPRTVLIRTIIGLDAPHGELGSLEAIVTNQTDLFYTNCVDRLPFDITKYAGRTPILVSEKTQTVEQIRAFYGEDTAVLVPLLPPQEEPIDKQVSDYISVEEISKAGELLASNISILGDAPIKRAEAVKQEETPEAPVEDASDEYDIDIDIDLEETVISDDDVISVFGKD